MNTFDITWNEKKTRYEGEILVDNTCKYSKLYIIKTDLNQFYLIIKHKITLGTNDIIIAHESDLFDDLDIILVYAEDKYAEITDMIKLLSTSI